MQAHSEEHLEAIANYSKTHTFRETQNKFKCSNITVTKARKMFCVTDNKPPRVKSRTKEMLEALKTMTPKQVAEKFDCTTTTVYSLMRDHGLSEKKKPKERSKRKPGPVTFSVNHRWAPPSMAAPQHQAFTGTPI